MSFATDINTVLQGDAALNTAVSSRIYSYMLPDNLGVELSSIVFTYKKEGGSHVLEEDNVLEDYSLYVVILSPDSATNETISALVRTLLDDYEDDSILDMTYEGDTNGIDQDKERFFKSLEYKCTFLNN